MIRFYELLLPALWFIWIFYWFAAARNVKRTQRYESRLSRLSHTLPFAAGIFLFCASHRLGGPLFGLIVPRSELLYWLGVILTLTGFYITVKARIVLGRNWSGTVTLKENHELIQTGPYRYVRHPIYTGLILAFFGSAVALDEWRGVLAVLLIIIAFRIKLGIEERWMTDYFGPMYASYRRRTKMIVPFIW